MSKPDELDDTMNTEAPAHAFTNYAASKKARAVSVISGRWSAIHPLDKEIAAKGIIATINALRKAGHTVEEQEFELLDYIVPAYYVLTTAEASSNLSRYDGIRYGHRSKRRLQRFNSLYKQNRRKDLVWK